MANSENTRMAESITVNTTTIFSGNMSNIQKLTTSNYLMWSIQVHALLYGYNLAGYLDGSTPSPTSTIVTSDITTVNPAFTQWDRQDKLILSGLHFRIDLGDSRLHLC